MSIRTCTVRCIAGPNGELVRCAYKPGHTGLHSWASLPTFIRPNDNTPVEIHDGRHALTGTLAHEGISVIATHEWWSAVCSSLGDDFPHVASIRKVLATPERTT